MTDENSTTHGMNDLGIALPKTANKPIVAPKKRGRKGDKIATAFAQIPSTPVDFIEYCAKHKLEPTVMRQIKRHDSCKDEGKAFVRKNKITKKMEIWRDKNIKS